MLLKGFFLKRIYREFLDKVQSEMDRHPSASNGACHSSGSMSSPAVNGDDVITQLFQGELVSQVTDECAPFISVYVTVEVFVFHL
jgi:hypothetical protein